VPAFGEFTSFGIFFLRGGQVAPVYRSVPRTEAVAKAALEALFAGPDPEEAAAGVETQIPEGTKLMSVNVDGGVATGGRLGRVRRAPRGAVTGRQPGADHLHGHAVPDDPEGLGGRAGRARRLSAEADDPRQPSPKFVPLILVERPALGETVSSPVQVSGTASVFEATLRVRLQDPDGKKLFEDSVTASEGAPGRGTFSIEIPFTEEGPATIVAFSPSARDSSEQHAFTVPVVLAP
jgi:hypothetical protein